MSGRKKKTKKIFEKVLTSGITNSIIRDQKQEPAPRLRKESAMLRTVILYGNKPEQERNYMSRLLCCDALFGLETAVRIGEQAL